MLRLNIAIPMFVPLSSGKQDSYTLERGALIRIADMHSKHGAISAVVVQGKYEGLKGNIPASYCASDTMTVI